MKRSRDHYKDMPDLRQRAIQLRRDGKRRTEICRELRVARSTVWRWLKLHKDDEHNVLAKPMGRPRRLSDNDRIVVTEMLVRGAEASGFDTPLWTLNRIAIVIHRITGVSYSLSHVSRWLHSMGWTCQKPERRARERDEEAIALWKGEQWPQIKKKQTTWVPR